MTSDSETSGRRTDAERQAIVAEAFEDGHSVSEVAERRGVSCASIYLWRRQLREAATSEARKMAGRRPPLSSRQSSGHRPSLGPPSPVTLVPVRIAPEAGAPAPMGPEQFEIALANGRILKVCESIDPMRLARLVAALESTAPLEGAP